MDAKSLNMGCGSDPWGDVVFSFITARFKPTVLANAYYLPFKSGAFKVAKGGLLMVKVEGLSLVLETA